MHGIDVNPSARGALASNAALNGLTDVVEFSTDSSCEGLSRVLCECGASAGERVLLVSDCEGHEVNMLHPGAVPELSHVEMLVECHDQFNRAITPTLLERFAASHDVDVVYETGVSALPAQLPIELDRYDWHQVKTLLDENRGCVMHWLHLVPKPLTPAF